jgi:hypothetical protein
MKLLAMFAFALGLVGCAAVDVAPVGATPAQLSPVCEQAAGLAQLMKEVLSAELGGAAVVSEVVACHAQTSGRGHAIIRLTADRTEVNFVVVFTKERGEWTTQGGPFLMTDGKEYFLNLAALPEEGRKNYDL